MYRWQRVAVAVVGVLAGAGVIANAPTAWSQTGPAGDSGGSFEAVADAVGPTALSRPC
jgi:hypothetical protein